MDKGSKERSPSLLKLDWDKNQKTKSSLKKTVAFADEGSSNSDTDKIMARMDAMTLKIDSQYKDLQTHAKKTKPDLNENDIPMSHKEEAKFMQTFHKARFYNDYHNRDSNRDNWHSNEQKTFMDLKTQLKIIAKNHQASIQNLETKFDKLADKQFGRPSGSLPSITQPNLKGHNSKAYQLPQSRNEHVNIVFTRSGKSYNPPVNPNDQQNDSEDPINFDSDEEDEEPTPQPKTQNPKPVKETLFPKTYKPKIPYPQCLMKEKMEARYENFLDMICAKQLNLGVGIERMIFNIESAMKHSYSNDDTCFSIIDEILEEDFDALLDEGSKILHFIEGILLEEEIFAEFDEFMAMIDDKNSDSESDTEEPPLEKITINTDYKIKTSLEEPPTNLKLKPLPDNLEYVFLEEPSFLHVIISSQLSKEKKDKLVSVLKKHKQAFAWKITDIPEKTTSTCPFDTYTYRRMPFGLCNTPATFQRCMLAIFHDMIEESVEVFMDDFSVFENSFKTCLINLDKMLQHCKGAHLVLNWEKCHFMVKEGIVLGHKVSNAGLEVDKAKINVISKLPPPTNIKEIKDRKGTDNVATDHLSRIENDETSDDNEVDDNFLEKLLWKSTPNMNLGSQTLQTI
nr:reverse transcriptase domain-containing protein [Tanacetum cinerariifolium]